MALGSLTWLALAVILVAGVHPAFPPSLWYRGLGALGALLGFAALLTALILLSRRSRLGYYLGVAALVGTALPTLFDQVGWADLAVLIVTLVPLALLIRDRDWYLGNRLI